MVDIIMPSSRRYRSGSKKLRQQSRNRANRKYQRQFARTVKRTGRWRGQKIK